MRIPMSLRSQLKSTPGLHLLVSRWQNRKQRRHRRAIAARSLPAMVAIELTNACNLHCAKCPVHTTKRARGFIGDALFQKILGDIQSADASTEVALSGSGEPTLHGQVIDFVRLARTVSNVTTVGFATNAVNLTGDLSEKLLDAGLTRLKVSLDTDDPAVYKRINRVDAYSSVVENLTRFCDLNKTKGEPCVITLKITLYDDDLAVARRLRDAWSSKVSHVRVTKRHNWAGLKGARSKSVRGTACELIWNQIQICWDGQITLCCFDSMEGFFRMGNVRDVNLVTYWKNDEGLRNTRLLHEAGDFEALPVCARCNLDEYRDISLTD